MALILLQLLLRQSEGCVTHQRRYGNLDPFWARALSMRATTVAVPTSLPQGPRYFLTRRALRLAEACLALISRVAQHGPHCGPFPPRRSRASGNSAIIQQAGDGIDAHALLGVRVEYQPHYICFRFDHFITSCRTVRFFHITIAVRRAREHVDSPAVCRGSAAVSEYVPFSGDDLYGPINELWSLTAHRDHRPHAQVSRGTRTERVDY